ncbi:MAG TPA: hypothetical protein VM580_24950, partial [Labilithrix sp.]|nr:hypothetical protein [Labilithrix sp.]
MRTSLAFKIVSWAPSIASTLVLVGLGAIPIQIDSIGGLLAGRRRRLPDDGRDRRGDRARSANFPTTRVRYIPTLDAVALDASGRLPAALEA